LFPLGRRSHTFRQFFNNGNTAFPFETPTAVLSAYKHDTEALLGRLFNHDDTLDDRAAGSPQQDAWARTRLLWRDAYQEPFALAGAMYRGDRPHARLVADPRPVDAPGHQFVLRLDAAQFQSCTMPEHVEQLWGPIPLPKLPEGTDNACLAATHKFVYTRT